MSTPHPSPKQGSTRRREIWRHAFPVAGPSPYCVDRLLELLELGLDRLVIVPGSRDADPALLRETNERFSREVLPALRGR